VIRGVPGLLRERASAGGDAVVCSDRRWSWDQLRRAVEQNALPASDDIRWINTAPDDGEPQRPVVTLLAAMAGEGAVAFPHPRWPEALLREVKANLFGVTPPPSAGARSLLFTSGSTGRPKAVVHDVEQHIIAARASQRRVPFGPGDRWLLSLPLCHVGGLAIVFRALVAGGAMELPLANERATDALKRARPTHVSLVAAQLTELLDTDEGVCALLACREVLVGGGPVAPALLRRAAEAGVALRQTYGATEMGSQACTSAKGAPASCGQPLDGVTMSVREDGVILLGGPARFRGYLTADGLAAPFEPDGSWATGDIGHLDEGGGLVVDGRADHRFISGGENIHPEMVEAALAAVPGVQQAVVVDVPDARFGARPAAFLLVADGRTFDDGALPGWLEDELMTRLPRFMLPVAVWPLPPPAGTKPSRAHLRALAHARRSTS
jgi:O-succinylbenzoic acid--CoA ligase